MSGSEIILTDPILIAAKQYYDLGLAPHWLRPRTKMPHGDEWNTAVKLDWKALLQTYYPGLGVGIRLGEASKIKNVYVGVIDLDIRSPDPRYLNEAYAVLDNWNPEIRKSAPCVATGRGFGSAHFYFFSAAPIISKKLGRSKSAVKVFSPTTPISGTQLKNVEHGILSLTELNSGMRMKSVWEVELMGDGRQVVAPPTIHPDTGIPYSWKRGLV